jgi:type IV pilus assembly protein PilE
MQLSRCAGLPSRSPAVTARRSPGFAAPRAPAYDNPRREGGNMRLASGFTLIELLVTVVVIGILASIALPSYNSYITRSKLTEAYQVLSDLRVKQEQRFQDARAYHNSFCSPTGSAATQVQYFDFACNPNPLPAGSLTFTIEATGKAGTELEGIKFTINENNARSTTVTGGSKMADKGFTDNGTCWVRKKPNQC